MSITKENDIPMQQTKLMMLIEHTVNDHFISTNNTSYTEEKTPSGHQQHMID